MNRIPEPGPAAGTGRTAGTTRPPGLRERKKAATRAAIREHALRLFREHGYNAATVEQIAEAAEVSPATFYRYFPTKEDVVLQDDLDLLVMDAFTAQPAQLSPVAAIRAAFAQTLAGLTEHDLARVAETVELTMAIPEVRARALDEFARAIGVLAGFLAQRAGRDPDDFAARNLAGAVTGVLMAAALPAMHKPAPEMLASFDAALAHLEAGLPL